MPPSPSRTCPQLHMSPKPHTLLSHAHSLPHMPIQPYMPPSRNITFPRLYFAGSRNNTGSGESRDALGSPEPPLGPNSLIFMQFSAKTFRNSRLVLLTGVGAHPREILDPPLTSWIELFSGDSAGAVLL